MISRMVEFNINPCGCNTMVSVLASQARYEGSIPFTRSRLILAILIISFLSGCATAPKKTERPPIEKRVPGALYHTVRRGETLWGISRECGVDLANLIRVNSVLYTGTIETGQVLLIPRSSSITQASPAAVPVPGESFIWPVRGELALPYGSMIDKIINKGIDIRVREGTGVRASRSGKVVYSDKFLKGFGKTVILDHGDNYQTVYSYNSEISVNIGDQVRQNTVIAKVGRTGRAKEPTLHFEVRRDGEPQNPFYYLPR